MPNCTHLNGIRTYSFTSRDEIIKFAFADKKSLIAVNAEKILHATDKTRDLFERNIGFSDGIGAVWALRKKGFKEAVKIPGCELWLDIIRTVNGARSFYLVGSKQDVIESTVKMLREEFPGIRIINYRNGFISTNDEKKKLIDDIAVKKPDVVFVAMGSPKQEDLIEEMQAVHPAVYQGLGGSFDVYTGNVRRAPEWWVNHNLEWAYRLLKQPERIKRQIYLVKFIWMLALGRM